MAVLAAVAQITVLVVQETHRQHLHLKAIMVVKDIPMEQLMA
jgi:hypothetical protein